MQGTVRTVRHESGKWVEVISWPVDPLRVIHLYLAGGDCRQLTKLIIEGTPLVTFSEHNLDILNNGLDFKIGAEAIRRTRAQAKVGIDQGVADVFERFEVAVDTQTGRAFSLPERRSYVS